MGTGLPARLVVFERGWLSSNNILFRGDASCVLVDSGYSSHSAQTVALVEHALGGRPLDALLNTHLHSDHCGGNAALQARYPDLQTFIPPGLARHVAQWDVAALTYEPTGQFCPPFRFDSLLQSGDEVLLGGAAWQVHSAPGHDPHSVILFEPRERMLISADALWENGFGVIFQELEGDEAFDEVGKTLDLIEQLRPNTVIPGHGKVFSTVNAALAAARKRLGSFQRDPVKHARHAAKVLLKFKLLELQRVPQAEFFAWAVATPYLHMVQQRFFADADLRDWVGELSDDLIRSGAARREGGFILNA
jgi:glyoxylase-like metal-dependent hydrolase (beta-lactamase superfamily II)